MGCCNNKKSPEDNALLKVTKIGIKDDLNESTDETNLNFKVLHSNDSCRNYTEESFTKLTKDDFTVLKLLGRGSFGKVLLVQREFNQKLYAMKVLEKKLIRHKNQEDHTKTERILLEKINNPFIIDLFYAFQDETTLYLVTEFMQGGDLFYHMHKEYIFSIERMKFYACELVLALGHLHENKFIYRDLKPENVLLDSEGHIKLTDFGLSIGLFTKKNEKAFTICGTPDYLAPEILLNEGYDKTVDWWSLGVLMYEMVTGISPFKLGKGENLEPMNYRKRLVMPSDLSDDTKDIINKLITINPTKRLGYGPNGTEDVKKAPFFSDINWEKIINRSITPPFQPSILNKNDLSNFDKCFINETIDHQDNDIPPSIQENFENFTYFKQTFDEIEKDDSLYLNDIK